MSQMFRTEALERLETPEELDQLLRTTSSRSWVAVATSVVLVGIVIVWSIVAQLPQRVTGPGVLVAPGSIHKVYAPTAGFVLDLPVDVGTTMTEGTTLMSLGGSADGLASATVPAPRDGRLAELLVAPGDLVRAGQQIAVLELPIEPVDLHALLYVHPEVAAGLRPGMAVRLAPDTVDKETYGFLEGRVRTVSDLPYSRTGVEASVEDSELASQLTAQAGGAPYQVEIELIQAPTHSGLAWTLDSGPPFRLTDGTLGAVEILTGHRRPISLLIPSGT